MHDFKSTEVPFIHEMPIETENGQHIYQWEESIAFKGIFVPVVSNEEGETPNTEFYYCYLCRKWNKFKGKYESLGNHASTKHHQLRLLEMNFHEREISATRQDQLIADCLTTFLLRNGLSFKLIEDPCLRHLSNFLPCRQTLSNYCIQIANRIKLSIIEKIKSASFLSVMLDEWSSIREERFLGVSIQGMFGDSFSSYVIALRKMNYIRVDSNVISEMLDSILMDFGIDKNRCIFVTDSASVMKAALDIDGSRWGPCISHQFNLIFNRFIEALKTIIDPIRQIQAKAAFSTRFTAFCEEKDAQYTSIPGYSPTRWLSMTKMLTTFSSLKNFINEYALTYDHSFSVPNEVFTHAELLSKLFSDFSHVMLVVESSKFGVFSRIIDAFNTILYAFEHRLLNGPPELSNAIDAFYTAYSHYKENSISTWGSILYAAALLNPNAAIRAELSTEERESGIRYIEGHSEHVSSLGQHFSVSQSENTEDTIFSLYHKSISTATEQQNPILEELMNFLQWTNEREDSDLLQFWMCHRSQWPHLSVIAIELLSLSITSTSVERLFSKASNLIGKRRSNLSPNKLESSALIIGNEAIFSELTIDGYQQFE